MISVQFLYLTGLKRSIFRHARLRGSWNASGKSSPVWTEIPMVAMTGDDGCPGFSAKVKFDAVGVGATFQWGVVFDTPSAANLWAIPTESQDPNSTDRTRHFVLGPTGSNQVERYFFTYARRLGARKVYPKGIAKNPGLRFAVWAPNAQSVEVVFGDPAHGYIDDSGNGIDSNKPVLALTRTSEGMWESEVIPDFAAHQGWPYLYRLRNAQGKSVYRTDLYSRAQMGQGVVDPASGNWNGDPATLDGTKGCSVVLSLDTVARDFAPLPGQPVDQVSEADFWANEFKAGVPIPTRVQDLVIYELHIGALGIGSLNPGNLDHAMALLPYLSDLGINAIELLPMSEFSGIGWGYGDSHHFVIGATSGGRDKFKHFVRACHQRGIAVIQDVVYNHWDGAAVRDQWQFDSELPEQNIYYWYEGKSADYSWPDGGYLNNGSSGYTPRFSEEMVRHIFISSAAGFMEDCHIDGFRVDLTQAMHRDNTLNANGQTVGNANLFGAKTLREWNRTLRLIRSGVMLIAEDHSGWNMVTQLPEVGGMGFDATWFAEFYHHLVGDSKMAGGKARLLKNAGLGGNEALDLNQFAAVLYASKYNSVVYHECHDEAGNDDGSMRSLPCAVNNAALIGTTRSYAEARARVAFSLALFSAGTPMFFMGEEIGAQKIYRYDNFLDQREDLLGERAGNGAQLFRFYQDAIRFSNRHPAVRSQDIDIIHVNSDARVIVFTRLSGTDKLLLIASLNNQSFGSYLIQTDPARLEDGCWLESFNSDAAIYGGSNVGNAGASLPVHNGTIQLCLPANGILIFLKT